MFEAIVYDRKSGCRYYAKCMVSQEGFVTLNDPIVRCQSSRGIQKFKNGNSYMDCSYIEYGKKGRSIMLPTVNVFIELMNVGEVPPPWVSKTEKEVEEELDLQVKEAQRIHDEARKAFLDKKGKFGRFLYNIFG